MSDNLRACAWRTADRCGLCSTAFRTASTFSGVLTVRADPPCFFFIAEAVVQKLCTQKIIVFHDGILPWRATLKCRHNFLCDGYWFAVFKNCLHDECVVMKAPLLHGNWNCKTLRFQWYPSHGNCTLHLHTLAVQKTSGFTGRPCIIKYGLIFWSNSTNSGKIFTLKIKSSELQLVHNPETHVEVCLNS